MAGMEDMLKRENVQIVEKVSDWEESVHVAVQPLVDQGFVKTDYIDGIISNAKEFGPYFVICPDLALLHARPEQGVIKRQLAVTVLREPVRFKEEGPRSPARDPGRQDVDSHINVMRKLAVMFSDPPTSPRLREAKDADEVYALFCAPTEE